MSLKRRSSGRTAQDYTIVIAYDGTKTEDDYFRGWEQILRPERLTLLPQYVRSGGNVLKAVTECKKRMRRLQGYAELWCVCDVDDTAPIDIEEAARQAQESGIRLCTSTRSFEVWLALHFGLSTRPILNEKDAISIVSSHLNYYGNPQKIANFYDLFARTQQAILNGEQLEILDLPNPNTKVHNLVRKLLQNHQ